MKMTPKSIHFRCYTCMYKHFSLEIIKNDDFERECTRPNKHSILHLAWYETCSDKKRDGEKRMAHLLYIGLYLAQAILEWLKWRCGNIGKKVWLTLYMKTALWVCEVGVMKSFIQFVCSKDSLKPFNNFFGPTFA